MKPIVLPAGTEHVLFSKLADLIADALWPDAGPNDDHLTYACAHKNIDEELARAVKSGALPVKDRLTLGPHTFPIGDALNRALVTVEDLRAFVAGRGVSVLFQFTIDYGWTTETFCATQAEYDEKITNHKAEQEERHNRNHYTMYEAAEVLAGAYDIGDAMSFLNKRMRPAVESGVLRITDPQDGGPINRRHRPYSDWVTPTAINEWLEHDRFAYRWPVPAMKLRQQTAACRETVINGPETRITDTPERMTADLIQFTDYEAGTRTTRNMTQAEHDEELEEKRERHEKGYYTMSEVAQILADAYNLDAVRLLETMKANYHAREIVIRNRSTEAPVLPGHTLRDFYDWMFPDDIRAMLKHWGGPWGSREFPFLTQNSATAQSPATPAPVVAVGALVEPAKAGPVALNTRAMADSFAGLHWGGEQWIKKLGDKPVWLHACIVLHRGRGEGMRLWNPVLIGAYLVRMSHVKANSVRAKFQTQETLKPWLDEWKTYEYDNFTTD